MTLTATHVLIANGYLQMDSEDTRSLADLHKNRHLVTVISNFNYYGYMPSQDVLERLNALSQDALGHFWTNTEKALKSITADDRQMDDFVVYQNFPAEVLEMSQAEYWCKQILMYWGFDKELFREDRVERDPLFENTQLKVLHLAGPRALHDIYLSLMECKNRWTTPQDEQARFLLTHLDVRDFTMAKIGFRENGIQAINCLMNTVDNPAVFIEDATDVLRLAALRSEADVSLRQKVKFKNFSRQERRFLCRMLDTSKNLEADMAERPTLFKLLLRRLHPGDFKYARLSAAYDALYNGRLQSYASKVEAAISSKDAEVFAVLKQRPGEFVRRFHHLHDVFGEQAVEAFAEVMPRMTTYQLLKMVRYTQTINGRKFLTFPPRGNWSKLQVVENQKKPLTPTSIDLLAQKANDLVAERLRGILPEGFAVSPETDMVKLQTNDQELAPYGRGTVFPFPENVRFLRSSSYWDFGSRRTVWYDNGWNFFDKNWNPTSTLCWNSTAMDNAAVFSGDPVSGYDKRGRGAQVIDLYIDKLLKQGTRYAVWNILCFSRVPFSAADEVIAALQWGEKPQAGKIFEPSRAQFISPIKGDSLTKYILYVDLVDRKVVYMDANLPGRVYSAQANANRLSKVMPAFVEYLDTLPSVHDLFSPADGGSIPVLYSDKDQELADNQRAYVFRAENETNSFQQLDLTRFL